MTMIAQAECFPVGDPITRGFTFASGYAGAVGAMAALLAAKALTLPPS